MKCIIYRMVDSYPAWGKKLEAQLPPGVHTVTFRARSPSTNVVDICRTVITIKGKICDGDYLQQCSNMKIK